MSRRVLVSILVSVALTGAPAAASAAILYSNLAVTDQLAAASRPSANGLPEIEAADDFVLSVPALINEIKFIGLVPSIADVNVSLLNLEIYRVFPNDSNAVRTSGPPTFSTPNVPTRVNSPSDVELVGRQFSDVLSLTATLLNPRFTALNSVLNGINKTPNQTTFGEGPVTGQEVLFDIVLKVPIPLPADHYFFVPQVALNTANGNFFWLSATRPIAAPPGTPIAPDLQSWIRNDNLAPDWLRIGTDIVDNGSTFNAAFELDGTAVPEPATMLLLGTGVLGLATRRRQRR